MASLYFTFLTSIIFNRIAAAILHYELNRINFYYTFCISAVCYIAVRTFYEVCVRQNKRYEKDGNVHSLKIKIKTSQVSVGKM